MKEGMRMKKKTSKYLSMLMAAVLLIAALVVPASAASSIQDQMAANSAAWHIANAAGDKATCDALHAANVALAQQAAGGSGSATFNSAAGTWDITTSSGSKITSSGNNSGGGKSNGITYTTTTSSGSVSSTSNKSYTSSSIDAYKNAGGTNAGLETAYNNDAARVTETGNYAKNNAVTTAQEEVAVVKELLGLTDAEAKKLEADLNAQKQAYQSAQAAYNAAVASGDEDAAAEAKAQMTAAHEAAEETRAQYNYTGDTETAHDGGYYDDWEDPSSTPNFYTGGGGFTVTTTYTITASCNEGGTIDPSGTYRVREGNSKTFTITPNEGYVVKSVKVDGADKGELTTYTFSNVRSAHTIEVVFAEKELTISASAGNGGTISPSGSVKVEYGSDKTFAITPNEGYEIQSVTVDGVNKGKINSYTFNDIKEAHSISASFVKKQFTISASAGTGGSITPSGTSNVNYGDSKTFTMTPAWGYEVESVIVDGVNKGALSSYTFGNIREAHSISVVFVPAGKVDIQNPAVTDSDGGQVSGGASGNTIKSGYGIFARVPASYSGVTDVKVTVSYNFGDGQKTVVLQETSTGVFEYPANAQSPLDKRCIYIPVATADGSYTLSFTITAKDVAGQEVSETVTSTVVVKGNMYEDDFTGDS